MFRPALRQQVGGEQCRFVARCCRMPEINAWAVGSVSWSNLRCSVAAVVSA